MHDESHHHHDHDHHHHHDHAHREPRPENVALLERVISLLEEKGLISEEVIAEKMAQADKGDWLNGARLVVRAWTDPAFKELLLRDGHAAVEQIGFSATGMPPLGVVENTADVHNMIVCTLCSCYPRWLLGYPPEWYKEPVYRSRAVREPEALLREWNVEIPENAQIRVVDSTADFRWLVLPMRPEGTEDWDEDALMSLLNRDCLIGADTCKL